MRLIIDSLRGVPKHKFHMDPPGPPGPLLQLWLSRSGCSTADYREGPGLGDNSTQSGFISVDADGTWKQLSKSSCCPLGTTQDFLRKLGYRTVLPCLGEDEACLWWHLGPLWLFLVTQMHYIKQQLLPEHSKHSVCSVLISSSDPGWKGDWATDFYEHGRWVEPEENYALIKEAPCF